MINLGCSCGRVDLEFDYGLNSASQQGEIARLIPVAEEHPTAQIMTNIDVITDWDFITHYNLDG